MSLIAGVTKGCNLIELVASWVTSLILKRGNREQNKGGFRANMRERSTATWRLDEASYHEEAVCDMECQVEPEKGKEGKFGSQTSGV